MSCVIVSHPKWHWRPRLLVTRVWTVTSAVPPLPSSCEGAVVVCGGHRRRVRGSPPSCEGRRCRVRGPPPSCERVATVVWGGRHWHFNGLKLYIVCLGCVLSVNALHALCRVRTVSARGVECDVNTPYARAITSGLWLLLKSSPVDDLRLFVLYVLHTCFT